MAPNLNDYKRPMSQAGCVAEESKTIAVLALCALRGATEQNNAADGLPQSVATVYNDCYCPISVPADQPSVSAQQSKRMLGAQASLDLDDSGIIVTELPTGWQLKRIKCGNQIVGTGVWCLLSDGGKKHFEHQLPAEEDHGPIRSNYNPDNFQVGLEDIQFIWWSEKTCKVQIHIYDDHERESILLEFEKEDTRDGFLLKFCPTAKIDVHHTTLDLIECVWKEDESHDVVP
ncbi:hypothetical protein LZ30DRAFT_782323 [Colletotrichum cereale]|nr:hypothetical protein LZ30DRAFT_782323 [Colletotrichum cereale]